MIDCFIFDLKGVVFETSKGVLRKLIREGHDEDKLWYLQGDPGFGGHKYVTGEMSYEEYVSQVKKVFPDDYAQIIETYFGGRRLLTINKDKLIKEIIEPYHIPISLDGVGEKLTTLEFIKRLYGTYDLCAFSGNTKEQLETMNKHFDFLKYFTYKIFSYEVGADKPDQKMFDALRQTLPYSPENCIFIDDRQSNIDAGNANGLKSLLFSALC